MCTRWCRTLGSMRFITSTGMAEMYSSATTTSPLRISRCFTEPSGFVTISYTPTAPTREKEREGGSGESGVRVYMVKCSVRCMG